MSPSCQVTKVTKKLLNLATFSLGYQHCFTGVLNGAVRMTGPGLKELSEQNLSKNTHVKTRNVYKNKDLFRCAFISLCSLYTVLWNSFKRFEADCLIHKRKTSNEGQIW